MNPREPQRDDDRGDADDALFSTGSPDEVFRNAIVFEMGLGFLAIFLGWLSGVDVRKWLPELHEMDLRSIATVLGWGIVTALPMVAVVELIQRIDWAPFRELGELEHSPLVAALLSLRPSELIALSIAAGVGEELLVRGWLMAWLIGPDDLATPAKLLLGVMTSAVAFGLMHPVSPTYVILATMMGLYLGAVVLGSQSLLIAIVAHAFYDAIQLLMSRRKRLAEEM
jgi:membrane protease YdiL (CAAX protease family)